MRAGGLGRAASRALEHLVLRVAACASSAEALMAGRGCDCLLRWLMPRARWPRLRRRVIGRHALAPCGSAARRCSTLRRPSTRTSRAGTRRAFRKCLPYAPCQSHARGLIGPGGGSSTRAVGAACSCMCELGRGPNGLSGLLRWLMPRARWPRLRRRVVGRHALAHCGGAARRCSTLRRPSTRTSRAGTRRAFRTWLTYAPRHRTRAG
jgi:hypothetical protein